MTATEKLIAGFVISGSTARTVLVRAVGPGLAAFGVGGAMVDPSLALYSGQTKIAENDNWGGTTPLITAAGQVGAFPFDAASRDAAVVAACGPAALKVILEVSELETYDNIRAASFLAMRVIRPGDFIKTSTGKTSLNATLGNNQVMLEAIRDHYLATGVAIGMKPAGEYGSGELVSWANHWRIDEREAGRGRFGAPDPERLRTWRKERAGEESVPAFVIFTDATLQSIAEHKPRTADALLRIAGVGRSKLDRYGEDVLALVG